MAHIDVARGATKRANLSVVGSEACREQAGQDRSKPARRPRPRHTPHLTADQYVRLLAFVEDGGGIVTLDEISRALPHVRQPISAVFDLCDVGILNVDWESAFDGDMRVWRVDR